MRMYTVPRATGFLFDCYHIFIVLLSICYLNTKLYFNKLTELIFQQLVYKNKMKRGEKDINIGK